jgi:hypothetical protein
VKLAAQAAQPAQDLLRVGRLVPVDCGDRARSAGELVSKAGDLLLGRGLLLILRRELEAENHIPSDERCHEQPNDKDHCAQSQGQPSGIEVERSMTLDRMIRGVHVGGVGSVGIGSAAWSLPLLTSSMAVRRSSCGARSASAWGMPPLATPYGPEVGCR